LIFTELFKYSLIIINLHSKSCTIKKCRVAFFSMWSCEILLYYRAWLKQERLCYFISITISLLVSISATRLQGAVLQILWIRHWKLNVKELDCNSCSHILKTLKKLLAKNLHWWTKVQIWPDTSNIKVNDMKPRVQGSGVWIWICYFITAMRSVGVLWFIILPVHNPTTKANILLLHCMNVCATGKHN
jgi:hypothetical protein